MLMKEAIIEVARELKKTDTINYQDPQLLAGYPNDLGSEDIEKALRAISAVSDIILKVS
tara:strand:- start:4782 stop:4958 length:177 start_codon:yes stop_codon:yes gene_type:complete